MRRSSVDAIIDEVNRNKYKKTHQEPKPISDKQYFAISVIEANSSFTFNGGTSYDAYKFINEHSDIYYSSKRSNRKMVYWLYNSKRDADAYAEAIDAGWENMCAEDRFGGFWD